MTIGKEVLYMNFPKLFIFDMDGLIFDTEKFAYKVWKITGEKFGFQMTEEQFNQLRGMTEEDIIKRVQEFFNGNEEVPIWRRFMKTTRNQLIDEIQTVYKMVGLDSLLDFLKRKGIKLALASSNDKKTIQKYLKFENMEDVFDYIVSGEDVEKGKPHPDIFLKVCNDLSVPAKEAIVLEDSKNGVKAAIDGGISVFWVYEKKMQ